MSDLRRTIREFLELVEGPATARSDGRGLARLLDRLALASHDSHPTAPEGDTEAPRRDYAQLRARVEVRFPDYGLYRAAGTLPEDEFLVGDAIDDLTDIALDLSAVAWLWEHAGESDALWEFHRSFETHWGSHLRALQVYVHELDAEARRTDGGR